LDGNGSELGWQKAEITTANTANERGLSGMRHKAAEWRVFAVATSSLDWLCRWQGGMKFHMRVH